MMGWQVFGQRAVPTAKETHMGKGDHRQKKEVKKPKKDKALKGKK
jgi:hypothetical protein